MPEDAVISNAGQFAQSAPSRFLHGGLKVNVLRTNALLRHEEWLELDKAVVDTAKMRLNGIADLRAFGLVHPLGGLGSILSGYELLSDMTDANVDMSGVTPGEEDAPEFSEVSVPVPITHKDFRVNIRKLEASRRLGDAIDVTAAQVATRKVVEKLEYMLFRGSTLKVNANPIYGFTTHPSRNTYSGADFGTISNIYLTINGMVQAAEADRFYGPYGLYVAGTQYAEMRAVYSDGSGQTAMDRCLKSIPSLRYIKPADQLADGSLVLTQLTSDVVDLAIAQDIVAVQWDAEGGMIEKFKIFSAMVPRIKADAEGRCGVVHATGC